MQQSEKPRRTFLKTAAAAVVGVRPGYLAGSDIIRIGMIGCGGRCTEAAGQAMTADKGARLVAMADVVLDRVQEKRKLPEGEVSASRSRWTTTTASPGFDALQEGDRELRRGAHRQRGQVPPHAHDGRHPGGQARVRREAPRHRSGGHQDGEGRLRAGRRKSGSALLSGLQSRFHPMYRETVQRVHDGAIGDIVAIQETWLRAPYVLLPAPAGPDRSGVPGQQPVPLPLALAATTCRRSLVHNLDRAGWAMRGQTPVKCYGMGGRSTLHGEIYGNVFDHHAVVYEFANGVRLYAFCRTIAELLQRELQHDAGHQGALLRHCRGASRARTSGSTPDRQDVREPGMTNPYQIEHVELFKAIRSGKPHQQRRLHGAQHPDRHHGPVQLLHRQGSHLGAGHRRPTSTTRPGPRTCGPTWSRRSSPAPTASTRCTFRASQS